jgi:hypothetical protein
MAMKEQQRSVYRTMQGKEIDMTKLVMQNEMTVAVGNVKVNARGDELGPGGKIIRKVEDTIAVPTGAGAVADRQVSRDPVAKNVAQQDPEGNE